MSSKRPVVVLSTLIAGLGAGLVAAAVSARRASRPQPPAQPIGRYGEPGPQWSVQEKVLIHRPAGEVAQHLHEHGGFPGFTGGLEGPAMDRESWDVEGTGHFEYEVHGLPGHDRTELTVRVAPSAHGVAGATRAATAVVLGTSVRNQVKIDLDAVRRRLEGSPDPSDAVSGGGSPSSRA